MSIGMSGEKILLGQGPFRRTNESRFPEISFFSEFKTSFEQDASFGIGKFDLVFRDGFLKVV